MDVLRGITVCGMILVNNAGACGYAYAPLKHAKWDGFTPADESQINSRDYIDGYEVQDVYAKKGLTDGSYVVYVVFNYICTGSPSNGFWRLLLPGNTIRLKIYGLWVYCSDWESVTGLLLFWL